VSYNSCDLPGRTVPFEASANVGNDVSPPRTYRHGAHRDDLCATGENRHEMDATGQRGYAVRSLDINYLSERQLMSSKDFKSQCTSWINH
jgi:hypothetical protein